MVCLGRIPVKNKGVLFLRSKLHTRSLVLPKVVTNPFMEGASWRNPFIRGPSAQGLCRNNS